MDAYLLLLGVISARREVPFKIVNGYGKFLVRLYVTASEAIAVMDTTGMEEAIKAAPEGLACETCKTIVLGMYGSAGKAMSGLEYLVGLITGKKVCKL